MLFRSGYIDPELVNPDQGNFAVGNPAFTVSSRDGGIPGYNPGYTGGAGLVFALMPFAYDQLEELCKRLGLFFNNSDAPWLPILRYLGPTLNGLSILTSTISEDQNNETDGVAYLGFVFRYILLTSRFDLDSRETELLLDNPGFFSLSDSVDSKGLYLPTASDMQTLARYLLLKQQYPDYQPDILRYLQKAKTSTLLNSYKSLSNLFVWND